MWVRNLHAAELIRVLVQGLSGDYDQGVGRGCGHPKAQLGEDWLPDSLTIGRISSSGCWTEGLCSLLVIARDMSALLCGPLLRAISNRAACLARGFYDIERGPERQKSQSFCNLISEVIFHHFCHIVC